MAKKDAAIEQVEADISVADGPGAAETRWITAEWGVYAQWRCVLCPFDTLDGEEAMLEHWQNAHVHPEPVKAPSVIQVYDKWGNPQRS